MSPTDAAHTPPVSPPSAIADAKSAPPNPVSQAADTAFQELKQTVHRLRPNEDLTPLENAFQLAARLHAAQTRKSGEPYLMHPLAVAQLLADQQMDMTCL